MIWYLSWDDWKLPLSELLIIANLLIQYHLFIHFCSAILLYLKDILGMKNTFEQIRNLKILKLNGFLGRDLTPYA